MEESERREGGRLCMCVCVCAREREREREKERVGGDEAVTYFAQWCVDAVATASFVESVVVKVVP